MNSQYATRFRFRRDTALEWETVNPILLFGEIGVVVPARKFKIADGDIQYLIDNNTVTIITV